VPRRVVLAVLAPALALFTAVLLTVAATAGPASTGGPTGVLLARPDTGHSARPPYRDPVVLPCRHPRPPA
jgi:hypothetical protein